MNIPVVGVVPRSAHEQRDRLFTAVGEAMGVRFDGREPGELRGTAAAISWDPTGASAAGEFAGLSLHVGRQREAPTARLRSIDLGDTPTLDPRLRGHNLSDPLPPGPAESPPTSGGAALASCGRTAVWVARDGSGRQQHVAVGPDELGPGEVLRDRLRDGRFLGLLPLLELVRRVKGDTGWSPPPPRACFLFDDPNLHRPTYGHLHFAELVRRGTAGGYHVAIATVPLDGWYAHPAPRALFAGHPDALSLIIHGNEHVRGELARPMSQAAAIGVARQALDRVCAFERRTGLSVGRVMAPPHGVCSETMAAALLGAGFEAITASRPYPWLDRPPAGRFMAGWLPAEVGADGLPVLPRCRLDTSAGELAIRMYLGQPLIMYGHHGDLVDGPELLDTLSRQVGRNGSIRWESVERIARTNVSLRVQGDLLRVRLHTRRASVDVPRGVSRMVVELPDGSAHPPGRVSCGSAAAELGEPIAVDPGQQLTVVWHAPVTATPTPPRRRRLVWPIVRRGMTEARDRSVPVVRRARKAAGVARS